jgi:integrase
MKHRLTDATVRKLAAPKIGNKLYYDTLVDGFALRVTANGARSFVLNYVTRTTKRERRYTIGSIDDWSAASARNKARGLRTEIDSGGDPLKAIEEERTAPTVAQLADRYVTEHLPRKRPRSREEDMPLLAIIRTEIGRDKVADVQFTEVDRLHQKVTKERGPFRANRVLAVLSKMMSLAIKWRMRPDNPCKAVERNPEPKRQRYLRDDELVRLMDALDNEKDQQAADIVRLTLLTGARISEVLNAEWSQFEEPGIWTKPHTTTKQKEFHRVPLADEAIDLLDRLRNHKSRYVFAGRTYDSFRNAWDRIRQIANIEDVRAHDLRHSHASFLVNAGFSLPVIGGMLGHKTVSTTARYAHLADDTLRKAAKSVGTKVGGR